MARVVLTGVAHHITQRGLDRQQVFFSDTDYQVYVEQIRISAQRFGTELFAFCMMPNHVHWIVAPREPESLSRTFGEAHGRYASYANAKLGRSGHFWQNRFFSCPLDRKHLWAAFRYVERNPVRARMVNRAELFPWSSAGAHTARSKMPGWLESEPMASAFTPQQWSVYLDSDTLEQAEMELRQKTYTGRPVGSAEFVEWAESNLGRRLAVQKGGRPRKQAVGGINPQKGLFE